MRLDTDIGNWRANLIRRSMGKKEGQDFTSSKGARPECKAPRATKSRDLTNGGSQLFNVREYPL
jgi:hypothetical protein